MSAAKGLKKLPYEYLSIISVLFNKCAAKGEFFERRKQARESCLSKDGIYPSSDKLRSISLLPNLAKWFERILVERIERWCFDNGINIDEQSEFTSNRRLQTCIVSLIEDLRLTIATPNRSPLTIFVNFLTVFDHMWYPALMKTLDELNMPLKLQRWLFVWLQNRSMTISHGIFESRPFKISLSAPRGSVLAALLFRMHIHFLPSYFPPIGSHLSADDLTLVMKGALELKMSDNIPYLEQQAKLVLTNLSKFSDDHLLPVNVNKTKSMIIHTAVNVPQPKVEYKNYEIEYVKSFKFLGVEIGTKLRWKNFITIRLRKIRSIYNGLKNYFILYLHQK
jgi:hypothetical protein